MVFWIIITLPLWLVLLLIDCLCHRGDGDDGGADGIDEFDEDEENDKEMKLVERIKDEKHKKYAVYDSEEDEDPSSASMDTLDQEDLENKKRRRDYQKGNPDCVFCENPIIEKLGDKLVTLACNHKHKAHGDCINYFKRH